MDKFEIEVLGRQHDKEEAHNYKAEYITGSATPSHHLVEDDIPFSVQLENAGEEASLIIECGDLCFPNPKGIGSWSLVIFCSERHLIDQFFGDIGSSEEITNNVMAYIAVIFALIWTVEFAPDIPVEICSSSQLVVNQINGAWDCRAENLKPLYENVTELLRHTKAKLRWIPLEKNKTAESLAQLAHVMAKRKQNGGGND